MKKVHNITSIGILTAVAMILSYIELLLPPIYAAIPGIKVGLPNIVIIYALYSLGTKRAAAVSFIRLTLSALLFNPSTFIYSLAGAVLSLAIMALLKKSALFSTVGVSIAGGVLHNLGQILVAICLLETVEIGYYMFVLAISGTLAGVFIGIAAGFIIDRIKKH
ncbi:MAG: Gx transporter family protein [Ruminococcaceae bacterium]|nr:Gx transporter family protein [Oscillospiraceae bacterium]